MTAVRPFIITLFLVVYSKPETRLRQVRQNGKGRPAVPAEQPFYSPLVYSLLESPHFFAGHPIFETIWPAKELRCFF